MVFILNFYKTPDVNEIFDFVADFEDEENQVRKIGDEQRKFVFDVFSGIFNNLARLDEIIAPCCVSRPFARLDSVALAILRLAVYEIEFMEELPNAVSINEAIELAKVYGDEDSPAFINGLLGEVAKRQKANEKIAFQRAFGLPGVPESVPESNES
jgi:N utilization substance protein B